VGTVGGIERKAFRKDLAQTLIGRRRVLKHRRIRLQQDVDGGDRSIGGDCATGAEGTHGEGARD